MNSSLEYQGTPRRSFFHNEEVPDQNGHYVKLIAYQCNTKVQHLTILCHIAIKRTITTNHEFFTL